MIQILNLVQSQARRGRSLALPHNIPLKLNTCGRADLLVCCALYAYFVLFLTTAAFAQSQPPLIQPPVAGSPAAGGNVPANKDTILQKSGVMEEQAGSQREKERVEEAVKEVKENVESLLEEVNKPSEGQEGEQPKGITEKFIDAVKPMNTYDFRASEGKNIFEAIIIEPIDVLANHTADYEAIGPKLFPNIMIPDIARLATNAAGFDEGTCYNRKINMQDWCAKILYMKVFGVKIPYGVRLTPSAEYNFPVSKTEAAQRPFVTRYIPHMQVGWMHKTITQTPQSLNTYLQLSSSYQAIKSLSLMGSSGNLNLPPNPLGFLGSSKEKEAAQKADEIVRKFPEKLRFVGQTEYGAGESVVVPELTSRMLKDVVNEQIPNYTLGITLTIFSFNLAEVVTLIGNIANIMNTLKMSKQIQDIMKLIQQAAYYKDMASGDVLKMKWKDLTKKLADSGKTVADLNLTQLGDELGTGVSQLQDAISGAVQSAGLALNVSVSIVKVEMLCHRPKRPASLDEWNPYTDVLASFFLKGGGKLPIGFYELSRFPVLMAYRPELQQYAKAYSDFLRNPQMCSIFNFAPGVGPDGTTQLEIKDAYPDSAICSIGMPLIDFSPKAPSPYDPQQSMKGAWNGFTLAAKYRPETFHQFDKDKDVFSWISPDPNLPNECGPLFRPYQWSGSKNTNGHANIQLPTDQPNVAVQWRHMHCCVDPEASPFRGLGPIQIFASDWEEVVE